MPGTDSPPTPLATLIEKSKLPHRVAVDPPPADGDGVRPADAGVPAIASEDPRLDRLEAQLARALAMLDAQAGVIATLLRNQATLAALVTNATRRTVGRVNEMYGFVYDHLRNSMTEGDLVGDGNLVPGALPGPDGALALADVPEALGQSSIG